MRIIRTLLRRRRLAALALAVTGAVGSTSMLQDAVANGDTRTISIHHVHSGESATITFKRNGRYDPAALQQLNVLLQDWRRKESTRMDPALFDIIWEVYREVDASGPIQVIGGYRSPETNAMLRARSRGVAQTSQHMRGKAMDFYIPGVPLAKIREAGLRLQRGGVGFYPTSGSPFVHLDTGGVRHWPRMTRDQLARVFPTGKTVHIPADGRPMPGYALALAEIEARGSEPGGAGAAFAGLGSRSPKKNIFAALFGGKDEDEEESAPAAPAPARAAPVAVAQAAPAAEEADVPAPASRAAAAPVAPPVAAAAAVVAAATVPLPAPKPSLPAAEAAPVAVAAANVPLPVAHPGREQALSVAAAEPAALAAAVPTNIPTPPARPGAAGVQVAAATPAAGLPALITTGGPIAAAPTVDVDRTTLSYASAGSFVAPRAQPGQAPVAPVLPAAGAFAHAPAQPAAHARPAAAHATARPQTVEAQAEIRRLFSSPTVARDTTLRTPELRRFAAFVAAPRQVVDGGFGRDASGGLDTARFSGAAVVAVPVVTLASATPLPPRRYWTASN